MRKTILFVTTLLTFAWTAGAWADLCPKCQSNLPLPSEGKCQNCGKETDSTALKLCPGCGKQRGQCEICLAKLDAAGSGTTEKPAADGWKPARPAAEETPPAELPTEPAPGAAPIEKPGITPIDNLPEAKPLPTPPAEGPTSPARIDPAKPGTYRSGKWQYQLEVRDPGTRSEGRWGLLLYDGQKLPRGEINDYYVTPWGAIYWVDVPKNRWGMHGWMTSPSPQGNRRGRMLNAAATPAGQAPAAKAAQPAQPQPGSAQPVQQAQQPQGPQKPRQPQNLELTKADSGKRARLRPGHVVVVRLPGNPTTGYQWQAAAMSSPALRLVARPQYVPTPQTAGKAGAGGTYVFQFQAVQPGTTAVKLFYSRPWERSKPPADTFNLGVEVLGQPTGATVPARSPANKAAYQPAPGAQPGMGQGGRFRGILQGR